MVTLGTGRIHAARAPRADGKCLRYRLDVFAGSTVDVVQSAGGRLYDRATSGWEATVLLPRGCDTRPLRILGVRVVELESGIEETGSTTQSLAVSADVLAGDPRVREKVLNALDHRLTEVTVWGDGWPLGVNRGMTKVQHGLSTAARAFKCHALTAAGVACGSVDPIESLLTDSASREP